MANWNLPTVTSNYLDFVTEINGRFTDVGQMAGAGTNLPNGFLRLNRGTVVFEEWHEAPALYWEPKIIALAGGGTGSSSAAGARANLGIGSMGVQNSNAVNITGGSITGVAYSASDITTGVIPLARGGTGSSLAAAPFGYPLMSDGVGRALFGEGISIPTLNASALSIGTVPAARLAGVALQAGSNTYTGQNVFNADPYINTPIWVHGLFPTYHLYHLNATTDNHYVRLASQNGGFFVQRVNDTYSAAADLIAIDGAGTVTCNGGGITNLNGANISLGQIPTARMGTGPANSTTFLRGDGTWQVVSSGGGATPIPSGLIGIFDTNCPAGWSRFAALDGRFPMGATAYGNQGGTTQHSHSVGLNTSNSGGHGHSFSGSGNAAGNVAGSVSGTTSGSAGGMNVDAGNSGVMARDGHAHSFGANFSVDVNFPANVSGNTSNVGDHSHQLNGSTADTSTYPPYVSVVYCRKN